MPRVFVPLLPLPVLAVLFAISCSRARTEETPHVIPYDRSVPSPAPARPQQAGGEAGRGGEARESVEEAPSAEEVKEFLRPVAK
jgi:hypothetical protein